MGRRSTLAVAFSVIGFGVSVQSEEGVPSTREMAGVTSPHEGSQPAAFAAAALPSTTGGASRTKLQERPPAFIDKWGSEGSGSGEFRFPGLLALDASGNVYVPDRYNHRIQKFDSLGNFLLEWGSQGGREGQFQRPVGIAVDPSGHVYVADRN